MQALLECIAGLQSCLMGLNMHLDYVACCSATSVKICLQPFHSCSCQLNYCCARKLVEKILFGHVPIVQFFVPLRWGRGNKVPNICGHSGETMFFEMVSITLFVVSEMLLVDKMLWNQLSYAFITAVLCTYHVVSYQTLNRHASCKTGSPYGTMHCVQLIIGYNFQVLLIKCL